MSTSISFTLRALSWLLRYPDALMRGELATVREALHSERALNASRLAALDALIGRLDAEGMLAEAQYVDLFDRGRGTALYLFEHVHGDSRDRGPAMVNLVQTYEQAGLLLGPEELPDHLCVLLEYASTQPAAAARSFISEFGHLLQSITQSLKNRQSDYAAVLEALLAVAGLKAVDSNTASDEEASLDDEWAEPPAFDGCSNKGQAAAGQPKTIHVIRRQPPAGATPR